jgi:hypothetical protein
MKKSGWRGLIEVGFILFLFYANYYMGPRTIFDAVLYFFTFRCRGVKTSCYHDTSADVFVSLVAIEGLG